MPLHSASYFAGVGTVVATMAIGFVGGIMLTDAFVGTSERAPTLVERRAASAETSPPAQAAVTPAPRVDTPVTPPVATAQQSAPQPPTQPQPQTAAQTIEPPAPQPPAQASVVPPAPVTQARLEDSMNEARDTDLKQQSAKSRRAAAAERRKEQRRKWAERRKQDRQRLDELDAVTERVRQAERGREREPVFRSFAAESPRTPILFDGDDE